MLRAHLGARKKAATPDCLFIWEYKKYTGYLGERSHIHQWSNDARRPSVVCLILNAVDHDFFRSSKCCNLHCALHPEPPQCRRQRRRKIRLLRMQRTEVRTLRRPKPCAPPGGRQWYRRRNAPGLGVSVPEKGASQDQMPHLVMCRAISLPSQAVPIFLTPDHLEEKTCLVRGKRG